MFFLSFSYVLCCAVFCDWLVIDSNMSSDATKQTTIVEHDYHDQYHMMEAYQLPHQEEEKEEEKEKQDE